MTHLCGIFYIMKTWHLYRGVYTFESILILLLLLLFWIQQWLIEKLVTVCAALWAWLSNEKLYSTQNVMTDQFFKWHNTYPFYIHKKTTAITASVTVLVLKTWQARVISYHIIFLLYCYNFLFSSAANIVPNWIVFLSLFRAQQYVYEHCFGDHGRKQLQTQIMRYQTCNIGAACRWLYGMIASSLSFRKAAVALHFRICAGVITPLKRFCEVLGNRQRRSFSHM